MPVAGPLADVHAAPELDASFVYMMPRAPKRGSVNKATGAAPEATEASAPEETGAVAATVKPRAATGGGTIVATVPAPAPEPTEASSPEETGAVAATVKPRAATGGGTIVATVPAPEPTEVSSAPKESSALVA